MHAAREQVPELRVNPSRSTGTWGLRLGVKVKRLTRLGTLLTVADAGEWAADTDGGERAEDTVGGLVWPPVKTLLTLTDAGKCAADTEG